jgi:DNA-binding NarL/FixJ family response regulator
MEAFRKKIVLILKDETLRATLEVILNGNISYQVVHEASRYHLPALEFLKPDLILVDLQPDEHGTGVEVINTIRKKSPHSKILVLSEIQDPILIFSSLRAGACGYILNNNRIYYEIIPRLNDLFNGGAPLSYEVSRIIVDSFHIRKSGLSNRETEVLRLLAEGKTYSEISKKLLIAPETSKTYIKNIYLKLEVNCKAHAIAKAVEKKIVYQRTCFSNKTL